jgi:HSP20 family protein
LGRGASASTLRVRPERGAEEAAMMIRWNPYHELSRLQREMNNLFESTATRSETDDTPAVDWRPAVDIYEDAERFVLTAEVTGIDPSKVDLRVEENRITLRGERKLEREEQKQNYHRIERPYGTFARTFTLPVTVDPTKIAAEYKHGLLHVSIPKKADVMPKQITVKIGE